MSPSVTADQACLDAVELARAAAVEDAGEARVGDYAGVEVDGDRLVTHRFGCLDAAYRGWHWAVSVTRAARARTPTVDEVVLLPGADAVLPPAWVPWQDRLRPGDVGVGDLLPTPQDDPRLAPAFLDTTEDDGSVQVFELGLGRPRVLSLAGLDDAVARWYEGSGGPAAPIARAVPVTCATCGFYLPLAGTLRQAFGVCGNGYAPDDGRVVAVDHGCGAHSEVVVVSTLSRPAPPLVDEFGYESVPTSPAEADPGEQLGHS